MRNFTIAGCILASLLIGTGCVHREGDFTVMSTKLVKLNDADLDSAKRQKNITGRDKGHMILIFPTKWNTRLETAVDDALKQGNGDVMTDVVVETYWWYIPLIYGQYGWRVKGDVVETREPAGG